MAATVKYNTLGVFVGPDVVSGNLGSGDLTQLSRVQSTNYQIEIQRNQVLGLGTAFANDGAAESPFVNLTIDYLLTNGRNEKALGLVVDGSHGSFFNINSGERDYFLLINKPTETPMVLAIGNGILTRYNVNASVNSLVRASVEARGFNIQLDEGTSGNVIPKVNSSGVLGNYTYELPPIANQAQERDAGYIGDNVYVGPRQLDIRFPNNAALGVLLSGEGRSHVQSFSLSVGLPRSEITRIGTKYPIKRCLELPLEVTLSANIILQNYVADRIQNYLCDGSHEIEVRIKDDSCVTIDKFWEEESETVRLAYLLRGMKMKSFSASASVDDQKSVDIEWSVKLGNLMDLNRNVFISGNFGRYLFPLNGARDVVGENVTGQNLQPIIRGTTYKRTKVDVEYPDFNVEFSGDYDIAANDPEYSVFYQGTSGIITGLGRFGSGLTETSYSWNADSYNTTVNGLPSSSVAKKFAPFYPKYNVGYPSLMDSPSGEAFFVTKGEGFNTEPVEISFANLPIWLSAAAEVPSFLINPYKPYHFNALNLNVTALDVPTGQSFEIQMVARNSKFRKVYTISGETPYSFHVSLPEDYRRRTSLFFQPYKETSIVRNSNNYVSELVSDAYRGDSFFMLSGSGALPSYEYKALNGKSYLRFESGAYSVATGMWLQDFRNFTFFAVYKPESYSAANAELLHFYNSGSARNEAVFRRVGVSQDLEFYYVNSGPSGLSSIESNHLNVVSTWDTNAWNLATISYDGTVASGRRGGTGISTQALAITGEGQFTHVRLGSGYRGNIAEMILFPYRLHTAETVHVENYLKYKWSL